MKQTVLICMCLPIIGIVSPVIASMTEVQILSQEFHVWGSSPNGSYDFYSTDGSGISGSAPHVESRVHPYEENAEFQYKMFVISGGPQDGSVISASAKVSVTFIPMESDWLRLTLGASMGNVPGSEYRATLSDLTEGITLIECGPLGAFQYDWQVYNTHTYSFSMTTTSQVVQWGSGAWGDVGASIPEPASLLLLALGGIALRYRRS